MQDGSPPPLGLRSHALTDAGTEIGEDWISISSSVEPLSVCLPVCLSVCLYIYLSIYPSIYPI